MSTHSNSKPIKADKLGKRLLFTTKELVLMALLSATLTAGKFALASIPNIEVVTLLLMVYTVSIGLRRSLMICGVFVLTECLIYGFNTWTVMYFVVWPLLVVLSHVAEPLLRRIPYGLGYAVFAGIYGFAFGFLCAVIQPMLFASSMGYFKYMITYWMSGLPFDIAHCIGNFAIGLLLYRPVRHVFSRLSKSYGIT